MCLMIGVSFPTFRMHLGSFRHLEYFRRIIVNVNVIMCTMRFLIHNGV